MSTVSGEAAVKVNPAPRITRPGLRGRRLVLMCIHEHMVEGAEKQQIDSLFSGWNCSECGTPYRKWVFLCAPLWREGWEWTCFAARWLWRRAGE